MPDDKLPELEQLTDSIVRGERVVLFAPGLWTLIATILLLIVATVLLSGSLVSICCSDAPAPQKAAYQFSGLAMLLVFVIIPSLLVFRGLKQFHRIKLGYGVLLSLVGIYSLLVIRPETHLFPLSLGLISAAVGIVLVRSPPYQLLCEFYYLLRRKKRAAARGDAGH